MSENKIETKVAELFERAIERANRSRAKTIRYVESYIRRIAAHVADSSVKDFVTATRIIALLEARLETIR